MADQRFLAWGLASLGLVLMTVGATKKNFVLASIAQSLFTAAFVLAICQVFD